jgi:hypothetical protein
MEDKEMSYPERRYRVVRHGDVFRNSRGFTHRDTAIQIADALAREHARRYVVFDAQPDGGGDPVQVHITPQPNEESTQ